jgi:hypothetical protein
MPTLSLGGQTLATQTNSDAPVLGSVSLNTGQVFPTGHIIQVVQAIKHDREILPANTSENIISDWTLSITPHKAGSKILIYYSFDTGFNGSVTARAYMVRSVDSGSSFSNLTGAMGTDGGSDGKASLSHGGTDQSWLCHRQSGMYLDSPSYTLGNSVQYRIGIQSESTTQIYIGSTQRGATIYHPRTASIMLGQEIAT